MLHKMKIGFVGAGKMGEALIRGILAAGIVRKSSIVASDVDKKRCGAIKKKYGVLTTHQTKKVVEESDIIILCVKPKAAGYVLEEIKAALAGGKLVISIMAGITTKRMEGVLGKGVAVVRAMPNTPCLVGAGNIAITAGKSAKRRDMLLARHIFSHVGHVFDVKEDKMDIVTAINGSGPAYVMYLMEAFIVVGMEYGLTWELALDMVMRAVYGSAILLEKSKIPPEQLREMVTSKGGTTEAALKVFARHKLDSIIWMAVRAAAKRSKELSRML